MRLRLHRSGRFRHWLGARFGGDFRLGDRVWRRSLHGLGAAVLVYFVLPDRFFVVTSTETVLFAGLAAILVLEALRHLAWAELPTLREFEHQRVASYTFYAVALVVAVLLFPHPIAIVVVLGTAFVDPLVGELRRRPKGVPWTPAVPVVVYFAIAVGVFGFLTPWTWVEIGTLAVVSAGVAVAVEGPRLRPIDDDLAMTLVPGLILVVLAYVWP